MIPSTYRRLLYLGLIALAVAVALLPWWKNHHYLRDLYDYGLVVAANGRMESGERPYVDFTTPIQAGFLGLNWFFERIGGGTYGALTRGGAALIVVMTLALTLLLGRRWPWWAAITVGTAITVMSASQHTILWHNALGVFCLALVVWAAACAPVWRRAAGGWHVVLVTGLLLGGINKLNFHLVGIAVALAWAVRAGLIKQAGWSLVVVSIAAILFVGLVIPVGAELMWTGASFSLWWANVVELAAGSRADIVGEAFQMKFLMTPLHDYYGPVLLPQAGLLGLFIALAALVGCWPPGKRAGASRWDDALVPLAAVLAWVAATVLMATNYEIVCLAAGAGVVLAVSLWLGFAPSGRKAVFAGGLVAPAFVLGVVGWWSAWQGQRSQFGYSTAERKDYQPAEKIGSPFAGLQGLRLPPDVVASLARLDHALPVPDEKGYRSVFYGIGMEWVDRFMPAQPKPRKPLWVHWGTSYGPEAMAALQNEFARDGVYETVMTTFARDEWPEPLRRTLQTHYSPEMIGQTLKRWQWNGDLVDLGDSFSVLQNLGGNVMGHAFHFDRYPIGFRRLADGRMVMGTARQEGSILINVPLYRFRAKVVLVRRPGVGDAPLSAWCKAVIHGAVPEDSRWISQIELPAGQQSIEVPFEVDASGSRLLLGSALSPESAGKLFVGFRDMEIIHCAESNPTEPVLSSNRLPETLAQEDLANAFFGSVSWRPQKMTVRGGRLADRKLELVPGGEIWWHTENMLGEIRGELTAASKVGKPTFVRVVWGKGGRLQVMQSGWVRSDQSFQFHAWTGEPGGWIGIMVGAGDEASPVAVQVHSSSLQP